MKKNCLMVIVCLINFGLNAQSNLQFSLITPVEGAELDSVWGGKVVFADVNGDMSEDVFISGEGLNSNNDFANIYLNDGSGLFTNNVGFDVSGVKFGGTAVFGDVDGDNDLDFLMGGNRGDTVTLFKNDGNGVFTLFDSTTFIGYSKVFSSSSLVDIDNDQDLDLIITFPTSNFDSTSIFKNDGNGNFTAVNSIVFSTTSRPFHVLTEDIDGDGDQDVLLSGNTSSSIYANDGSGNFNQILTNQISGSSQGDVSFSDVDGDSDLDLMVMGFSGGPPIAELYINNGGLNFTKKLNTFPQGYFQGDLEFADLDLDGDQDLIIGGDGNGPAPSIDIYLNDGNANFVINSTIDLAPRGMPEFRIGVSDIEGDNDSDVLITCRVPVPLTFGIAMTYLYRNDLCSSDQNNQVVDTCGPFTWIDGNTYTTNNNTATYTLTNVGGCDSTVTLNLTTTIVDTAVVSTSDSLYANATNLNYQWINCDRNNMIIPNATQKGYKPDTTGNFAVIITNGNCSDTSSCHYIDYTYLKESKLFEFEYNVYPNPNQGFIQLQILGNEKILPKTAIIYDINGKHVMEIVISKSNTTVDVSKLKSGVYFLAIGSLKKKIIIR